MTTQTKKRKEFRDIVEDIDVAMLTTIQNNKPYCRPMALRHMDEEDSLWFLTDSTSEKIDDIEYTPYANVSFSDPEDGTFLSVTGKAEIIRDEEKQKELWTPLAKVWFEGPDDPKLVLLKLKPEEVEYWDSPSNPFSAFIELIKKGVNGAHEIGDHGVIDYPAKNAERTL